MGEFEGEQVWRRGTPGRENRTLREKVRRRKEKEVDVA